MRKGVFLYLERHDKSFSRYLRYDEILMDGRDSVFVFMSFCMLITVVPSALMLFVNFSYLRAVLHMFFIFIVCAETFMSMLHNASHRELYCPSARYLNAIIPLVLAIFFGQTWSTYFYHHVKHHHVEDNGARDLSSTRLYQRDSFLHFLLYFCRFFFGIQVELPLYFLKKGHFFTAAKALFGELAALSLFAIMIMINFRAGITVFAVPFCVMRFFMMCANWGQHAFINPDSNSHSLTIIGSSYNVVAFNDGFHASHHMNSQRHWSEHQQLQEGSFKSLTFEGDINFGDVWWLLMTKNYNELEHFLVFDKSKKRPSKECIIDELKRQVAPIKN